MEHLADWLESWVAREKRQRLAGDTRPWAPAGRQWAGFAETFIRVLAWYKPEISTFRDLGWRLRPDAIERVADALQRLVTATGADASLSEQQRAWLKAYDVRPLAFYTAIDDRFETLTEQPIRTVVDFGSGIGRQAFLWSHLRADVKLYSVDAIESFYLLQSEAYRRLFGARLVEYFTEPAFDTALAASPADAVVHLPTWRLSAIPDASVDLLICVQVLQELSEPSVRYLLQEFRRVVRPGGLCYIRDKEFWMPAHKIRVGRALLSDGWRLVFRYPGDEGTEIAGVPRLWINAGDDTSKYFRLQARLKRAFLPSYSRSFRSWRDLGLPI
jgi:SAM-dependent methyltransferase